MNEMTDTIPSRAPQSAGEPALEPAIERATKALSDLQRPDGHWLFELEADATIPAEYVLLQHYLREGDAVPVMPVEIMLLPRAFPFHIGKISYWARTVIVPLLVLQALKPKARNPRGVRIDELFLAPPAKVRRPGKAPHQTWRWFLLFEAIDAALRMAEPWFPRKSRRRAIERAEDFVRERLN